MKEALYYNEEENIIATVYYSNGVFISSSKLNIIDFKLSQDYYNRIFERLFQKYTFIGYL